ncbi:hypothetical protein NE237_028675 [Protea cynaroides]|uniref:Uncharacterized protein n=1 Tax=Protea cynaroides TaxID=273540 RepID=A0A9Q0JVH7_9MAGN|nr:hypothetical protein NE237_028675 [Protea cynaroides]
MRACYLHSDPRIYCKIIQHNLIPQSGHYERMSQLTQYLLYYICTRQPVFLQYIIMCTMITATLPSHTGNLLYGSIITTFLTRLGVDLVDEKIQEKSFSSPLDWEAICKMGMRDAQVSDEERNAMVRPCTRVEIADAEAAAAAAGVHMEPASDDDHLYMDVDSIPPPSPTHVAGVSTSYTAGLSHPPSDMMEVLHEIREAQRRSNLRMGELLDAQRRSDMRMGELIDAQRRSDMRMEELLGAQRGTDQWVADLTASLQTTQTQIV